MSRYDATPAAIHVWPSPECDTAFSISIVGDDGDEISCIGGARSASRAMEKAVEYRDDHARHLDVVLLDAFNSRVEIDHAPAE